MCDARRMGAPTNEPAEGRPRPAKPLGAALRHNAVLVSHMLLDAAPDALATRDGYLWLRRLASTRPERFDPAHSRPGAWQTIAVSGTALCVEGFHGSGNTFAAFSIREAADPDAFVSSHLHMRVQLARAKALDVPTVVLVREPRAACDSLKSKRPELADALLVLRWIQYHLYVARCLRDFDVFRFEDVVADVDLLRRRSEAVRRIVGDRPIAPQMRHRNRVERRATIAAKRPLVAALLARADRLYARIAAEALRP